MRNLTHSIPPFFHSTLNECRKSNAVHFVLWQRLVLRFKGIAAYDMKVFSMLTHERAHMDFIIIECPISCFDHTYTRAHTQPVVCFKWSVRIQVAAAGRFMATHTAADAHRIILYFSEKKILFFFRLTCLTWHSRSYRILLLRYCAERWIGSGDIRELK